MEQYYAQQAQLPHFSGPARQRGSGFGSLAAGVWRVVLQFAKKLLLPNVKSGGKEFSSQSIPELLNVASKKKTPKQAVQLAVRKTVKKQLGGSKRRGRGKQFIRRKKNSNSFCQQYTSFIILGLHCNGPRSKSLFCKWTLHPQGSH